MAVLTDADRAAIVALLGSDVSRERSAWPLSKADTRAAINAADSWANSNAASYNAALPAAAQASLSARQKALVLMYVIRRRYEVS